MGGVARNLATALQYLGHQPHLLTALARDKLAELALGQLKAAGLELGHRKQLQVSWSGGPHRGESQGTSCFALVLMDSIRGQCEYVIANLDAMEAICPQSIEEQSDTIREANLLVMDANLRADTMESIMELCHREGVPIFLEPTDVIALPRLVQCIKRLDGRECLESIMFMSPNLFELQTMKDLFEGQTSPKLDHSMPLAAVEQLARDFMASCMPSLTCLLVTLDRRGLLLALRSPLQHNGLDETRIMDLHRGDKVNTSIRSKHFPPAQLLDRPVSASGAGDSFAAGFISGLIDDRKLSECIERAFEAARMALNSRDTIPESLKLLRTGHNKHKQRDESGVD